MLNVPLTQNFAYNDNARTTICKKRETTHTFLRKRKNQHRCPKLPRTTPYTSAFA